MKNIYYYTAIFHKEGTGYSVWLHDIPGCISQGDTLEDAVKYIKEALGLFYEDYRSKGKEMPEPTDPGEIRPAENEFAAMVEFNALDYMKKHSSKSVKKTLSIPAWLNELAEENHINFSSVLQSALKERLNVS